MAFPPNNFLQGPQATTDERITTLEDTYFRRDGTITMTGSISAGGNQLIGTNQIQFDEVAAGITPGSGRVALYALTDSEIYAQDDLGVETKLSGGGDVDGPASAVDSNLASFDGTSGELLQDSLIAQADVVTQTDGSVTADAIPLYSGTTGRVVQNSVLTVDSSGDISKSSSLFLHEIGNVNNLGVGSRAGESLSAASTNCVLIGQNTGRDLTGSITGNVLVGSNGFLSATAGANNCGLGDNIAQLIDTGSDNVLLGSNAGGAYTTTESNNSLLDSVGVIGDSNTIRLGNASHTSCFLAGVGNVTPGGTPEMVTMDPLTGEMGSSVTAGDVVLGPASATDTAIVLFNTTDGKIIQDSVLTVDSAGDISKSSSLFLHEPGTGNLGVGSLAGASLGATPTNCVLVGQNTGTDLTGAITGNVIVGSGAFLTATSGSNNVSLGTNNAALLDTGSNNTLLGADAGASYTTSESNNSLLDSVGVIGESNVIRLGNVSHTSCFLAGVGNVTPSGVPEIATIDPATGEMGSALVAADVVTHASTSTDEALMRFDGTTGRVAQNSVITLDQFGTFRQGGSVIFNTIGTGTTGAGFFACDSIITGQNNTGFGRLACTAVVGGDGNTGVGVQTLDAVTEGDNNTALGAFAAGGNLTTGDRNLCLGASAGSALTLADSDNICIMNAGVVGVDAAIRIGNNHTSCFIDGIEDATLSNETTSTMVVDSHNQIVGKADAMPRGSIDGLVISNDTVATKVISSGACRSDDNTFDLVSSGVLTPSLGASGANGLDTGAETADTWYSIWIIGDSVTSNSVASLLSLSSSSPTLPANYDKQRRIGWARNDGSSDFYDYFAKGNGVDRTYYWEEDIDFVLNGGSATTRTAVPMDEWAPPTCTEIYIQVAHNGGVAGTDFVSMYPTGGSFTSDLSPWKVFSSDTELGNSTFWIPCDTSQSVDYENDSTGEESFVSQVGYADTLSA